VRFFRGIPFPPRRRVSPFPHLERLRHTRVSQITATSIITRPLLLPLLPLRTLSPNIAHQAKKGLHPLLYKITVVGTKGGTFETFSTVQYKASRYFLTADQDSHELWTGKKVVAAVTGVGSHFKGKFANFARFGKK
jgi:ribosomal protein L31